MLGPFLFVFLPVIVCVGLFFLGCWLNDRYNETRRPEYDVNEYTEVGSGAYIVTTTKRIRHGIFSGFHYTQEIFIRYCINKNEEWRLEKTLDKVDDWSAHKLKLSMGKFLAAEEDRNDKRQLAEILNINSYRKGRRHT